MNTFIVEAENYKTLQTEIVDLSEYGITPDSVYSIKFEKGQDDILNFHIQVLQFIQKRSYHRNLKIYIAMQATNMAIIR